MNRCNVLHFAMMKATTGQEGEPAMGPATGIPARGDLRNDYIERTTVGVNKAVLLFCRLFGILLWRGVVISLRMDFMNGMSASFAGQCSDLCRVGVQTLAFK